MAPGRTGSEPGIAIKRIYLPPDDGDGHRVLVDRLWPRGLARSAAHLDDWLKAVAPSPDLRKWFNHDPAHWQEFQQLYRGELRDNPAVETLLEQAAKGKVTLLYAAHDETRNHALVLLDYLLDRKKAQK